MRYPKIPSFRPSLVRLHRDLLGIDDLQYWVNDTAPLTRFEIMVLLLEDRRFFEHYGVDWKSVVREGIRLLRRKRHGGASTIDMQLFRTVSNRYERTFRRKVREWVGVLLLQKRASKMAILRGYLNVAYFGTGLSGAHEGAEALFPELAESGWKFDDLTPDQAAQLASLLVYPKPRFPTANWSAKVRRRADYGLSLYVGHEQEFKKRHS